MKVWYDACTGKHVRYGTAIAKRLRNKGYETILTTRKHPDTLSLAEFLGEKFITVGRYNPKSLLARLKSGTRRQLTFCKMFENDTPDIAISHCSVDQCRVAFGLGKPIISTIDTPYANAVNKLTLPLSNFIVASNSIPKENVQKYVVDGKIVGFDGVDEVAWIKGSKPKVKYDFGKPTIVMRQLEEKAAYAKDPLDMITLAKKLTQLGTVIFLSRYTRKTIEQLVVPKNFVDSTSLVAQADLFIGVGGTITREAALQGTPAIIVDLLPTQHTNDFLATKGFPIFKTKPSGVLELAKKLLEQKKDVKNLLDNMENPIDTIEKIVEKTTNEN